MKANYTHLSILLDASTSMNSIKSYVIEAFNNFIQEQKETPGETTLSLVQFSSYHDYAYIYDMVPLDKVEELTNSNYLTRGMTALNDAMAKLINETGQKLAAMQEDDRPSGVMLISITDGEENDSREATANKVAEMVKHQQEKYNWQFIYIGANQDAKKVAKERGISAATSLNFEATRGGVSTMFRKMSKSASTYRSNNADFFSYTDALQDQD